MSVPHATVYRAEITNHGGFLLVVLFSAVHLFSRDFRKICDAERWLMTLARRGLTPRTLAYLNDERRYLVAMPPFGAIAVHDGRARKEAILPAIFR